MSTVSAVILAAGGARRMGLPKQLLPWKGSTLLGHAIAVARESRCSNILVVLGAYRNAIHPVIADAGVFRVVNPEWSEGLGSSIRTAIRTLNALPHRSDAALIQLADQPLVTAGVLDRLIETFERTRTGIVASEYGGEQGTPALFDASLFPELSELEGQAGVQRVIARHPDRLVAVPFAGGVIDLDTREDYRRMRSLEAS